ncbi:MAG: LuxR C-terminal-related transcriptional regulator [Bacteroidales bacterium]|nr:LuxR C-terminal-related transcriptional regulator [Bacteroidales bacterium]
MKPIQLHISGFPLLLLFLLSLGTFLQSQPVGTPLVLNFETNQYQAENQNWSVTTREDGLVFFGNNKGLLQTDGIHWKLTRLPGNITVRSVATDGGNRIYAGGFEEFGYFLEDETGELTYFSLSRLFGRDQLHNDEFWRIIPLQGKIYFQSFSSIFVYDGMKVRPIELPGTIVLLQKVGERLFIDVVDQGLHELVDETLVPLKGMEPLKGDEIKMVLPAAEGRLLVGAARKGLYIYDGKTVQPWNIRTAGEIRNAEINNGLFLDGNYFIGTIVNGMYVVDKQGNLKYHLHAGNALQNNTVLSLTSDPGGNIWLGLDRGISHVIRNDVLSYYLDPSGEMGTVFDAAWYRDHLLLGTNLGLISMRSNDKQSFSNPELIEGSQGQVWDLFRIDDDLLVGHNSGTYRLDGNRLTEISPVNGGFDMQLYDNGYEQVLIQSSYSSINVYRKREGRWQFSNSVQGIIEPFSKFEIDPYGNIWAAHLHRNIFRIKLNETLDSIISIRTFGMDEGFPADKHISVSKIENRVVFPTGERIYTYDDLIDTIIPYERLNKALGVFNTAAHIIPGDKNKYWFIKDQRIGYFRISGSDIDSLFAYNLAMQDIRLGKTFPRIVNTEPGKALVCIDKGFAIYQETETDNTVLPEKTFLRMIISSGSQEQKRLPLETMADPVDIPYSGNNLTFTYSTLPHYRSPHFRFRLEGLETKWSDWTDRSTVEYVRIPRGKYTFMVQASNIHMQPGPVTEYRFTIHPPWYFSATAIIIYSLLLLATIILVRLIFLHRLKLHAMKIEREEQQKIKDEKLRSEQEFTQLKNELLQKDLYNRNNQLADYTMNVIRKNEVLMQVKEEIEKQKTELGDRYPNYLYHKLMNLLDTSITSEDEWKVFEYHFDQTHENFFRRLKQQYPELTPGDMRLCAYLRMNLSSKELAPLLNISHKSVEVHRSRLRKKLKLKSEDNLVEFLLEF